MSNVEANLIELHRLFRELLAENAALRQLLADYERLADDVPSLNMSAWEARRIELKARYEALMEGKKP